MTRLLAYMPVSPHAPSFLRPNGLHKLVTPRNGLGELVGRYCPPEVAELVDGRLWVHPWGKWSRVPWLNPFGVMRWTGMRLDAKRNADRLLPWLSMAFAAHLADGDEVYTGGVPPTRIEDAGLDKIIETGHRVWFDGTSANDGTLLHRDMWRRHKDGQPVGAEANRKSESLTFSKERLSLLEHNNSVPVISDYKRWLRTAVKSKTHWTLDFHPRYSAACFRNGVGKFGLICLEHCVDVGLDIVINFGATPKSNWERVAEIVRR